MALAGTYPVAALQTLTVESNDPVIIRSPSNAHEYI
jgi:hypothetical protein